MVVICECIVASPSKNKSPAIFVVILGTILVSRKKTNNISSYTELLGLLFWEVLKIVRAHGWMFQLLYKIKKRKCIKYYNHTIRKLASPLYRASEFLIEGMCQIYILSVYFIRKVCEDLKMNS